MDANAPLSAKNCVKFLLLLVNLIHLLLKLDLLLDDSFLDFVDPILVFIILYLGLGLYLDKVLLVSSSLI